MPAGPIRRSAPSAGGSSPAEEAGAPFTGRAPAGALAPTAEERAQHALELGFKALARRDRTVAEVRWHLTRRECDPDAIEAALAELAEQGYLDDARYALRFAEDRRLLDGWGAERIARRLEEAGVPAADIEAALGEQSPEDELEAAVGVLRGKLRTPPEDDRGRERALGLLVRRGYGLELAHDAIRAFERE